MSLLLKWTTWGYQPVRHSGTSTKKAQAKCLCFIGSMMPLGSHGVHLAADATACVDDLAAALGLHASAETNGAATLYIARAAGVVHGHVGNLLSIKAQASTPRPSRPKFRADTLALHPSGVQFNQAQDREFIGHETRIFGYYFHRAGACSRADSTLGPLFGVYSGKPQITVRDRPTPYQRDPMVARCAECLWCVGRADRSARSAMLVLGDDRRHPNQSPGSARVHL